MTFHFTTTTTTTITKQILSLLLSHCCILALAIHRHFPDSFHYTFKALYCLYPQRHSFHTYTQIFHPSHALNTILLHHPFSGASSTPLDGQLTKFRAPPRGTLPSPNVDKGREDNRTRGRAIATPPDFYNTVKYVRYLLPGILL
ncbi:hypothetical protein E2C01_080255 [Portunus trituberculatus]|uniref:Uncharacterized protein n=1 Tax=Portunus trituberculatus TaxID=210409 RepID=A0A5B7IVJ1_PORTR|nr:hypothetical protein [Portunus trituberculatus]